VAAGPPESGSPSCRARGRCSPRCLVHIIRGAGVGVKPVAGGGGAGGRRDEGVVSSPCRVLLAAWRLGVRIRDRLLGFALARLGMTSRAPVHETRRIAHCRVIGGGGSRKDAKAPRGKREEQAGASPRRHGGHGGERTEVLGVRCWVLGDRGGLWVPGSGFGVRGYRFQVSACEVQKLGQGGGVGKLRASGKLQAPSYKPQAGRRRIPRVRSKWPLVRSV